MCPMVFVGSLGNLNLRRAVGLGIGSKRSFTTIEHSRRVGRSCGWERIAAAHGRAQAPADKMLAASISLNHAGPEKTGQQLPSQRNDPDVRHLHVTSAHVANGERTVDGVASCRGEWRSLRPCRLSRSPQGHATRLP